MASDIKTMFKRLIICLFVVIGILVLLPSAPVRAADSSAASDNCDHSFLTFPPWYHGLTKQGNDGCEIKSPTEAGGFSKFTWTIVLNIIEIMLNVVGYAAVGFIIYGGIKYIYSAGSPNGMQGARKTILNAVIGLIISIVSVAIVNTISGSL